MVFLKIILLQRILILQCADPFIVCSYYELGSFLCYAGDIKLVTVYNWDTAFPILNNILLR